MDKTQYCQDIGSSQVDLQIQSNPNKKASKLFCMYQQNDSKVYMERQKTQKSQHNVEKDKNKVGALILPDFKIY